MQTNLIDPEGFPRSDIDVASIRTARSQINRLRNDLKGVISDMSRLLEKGLPNTGLVEMEVDTTEELGEVVERDQGDNKPFAKVDGVFPNSPADAAVSTSLNSLSPSHSCSFNVWCP